MASTSMMNGQVVVDREVVLHRVVDVVVAAVAGGQKCGYYINQLMTRQRVKE